MISNFFVKKKLISRSTFFLYLLVPFLLSCSSDQNNVMEIVVPPQFPNEFSSIPDQTDKSQLLSLISVNEKINNISVGRDNPFLPPQLNDELLVPSTFKYFGQISSANTLNAFVSYEDRKGFVKIGDIGGENTNLLPTGWTLLRLNLDTKVLTLGFEERFVDVDLFSQK